MLLNQQQLQDPFMVVDFIVNSIDDAYGMYFVLTGDERELIDRIRSRTYTGQNTSAQDLHELRILYWQVVGFLRK